MKFIEAINEAKEYLGIEYFNNLNITFVKREVLNLLKVVKKDDKVIITYGHLSKAFRGLTLIKEKHRESSFEYESQTSFKTSGAMVDCSRNGVLKNEKIKELILLSALMGHNRFMIYTEDILKIDKYPYFGYLRGAYSKEDIKDFVSYGESFGVELVPCIQTLGHLKQVLKWAPMDYLKDSEETLLIDSPKVYEYIEDIIQFCRECFNSEEIHIGMDESFDMGLYRHLKIHGYEDRVALFSRHLLKVKDLCTKYNFSPMIWSDMYFRFDNTKDNGYYGSTLSTSTIKSIPSGVKLVYWDYYHDRIDDYIKMIQNHKKTHNEIVFAGGSWRWKGFAPSIKKSLQYTRCALDACLKENINDVFITAWGDDGNECSFFSIIPVLAELSVMNYSKYDESSIDSLIRAISSEKLDDFYLMDLPDLIQDKEMPAHYNPSKYFFYQDVLLGMFDLQVKEDFAKKYLIFKEKLLNRANSSEKYSYIYCNLANLCDVLSNKVDLGVRLRKAYKNKDFKTLKKLKEEIETLIFKIDRFHASIEKQWLSECKAYGYEVLDGRIGFLKNRILTAKNRIEDYLDKKIDKIEELETDILPFDGRSDEISWNWWFRNISPSN